MKKILSVILFLSILFSAVPSLAVVLEVDGVKVESDMIFTDSTCYVPLSSIGEALSYRVDFDEKTKTAFVNGINLFPKATGKVTVYVNGELYTPTDNSLLPKEVNGEVYLPAHLAAEAFGKDAKWYKDTATLVLSDPIEEIPNLTIDPNKTYAIINKATQNALTAGDNSLSATAFTKSEGQKFKFVKTEFDGYYHIQSVLTGKNLDVNAHGTTPGVSIITWDKGDGDNQKFTVENVNGGSLISARSCHLPIEEYSGSVFQNTKSLQKSQKWQIVEFNSYKKPTVKKATKLNITYTPPVKKEEDNLPYSFISIDGLYLSDSPSLAMSPSKASESKWAVTEHSKDIYIIENVATKKSLDVNARSLKRGDSIITWQTSRDTNQRWILEKNGDGTYYIKSVHSSLYLTLSADGKLIQEEKSADLLQRFTIEKTN